MGQKKNIFGVAKIELGAPGDGIMGASLTEFSEIEVGSVNIEGSQANQSTIPTEDNDSYITLNDAATAATLTARLYGVTPTQMVMLAGGVVNGTDGLWEAPGSIPNIFLSCRLTGKPLGGEYGVIEMAYAKVVARLQGTITKNGLPAVDLLITANTPIAADTTEGPPVRFGTLPV